MFAGPNGSGKSRLKSVLPAPLLGVYLNPDEVEAIIQRTGELDLSLFSEVADAQAAIAFLRDSSFLREAGVDLVGRDIIADQGFLCFRPGLVNAYLASAICDFLRQQLLSVRRSFTLETVMSHRSKIDLLAQAQAVGYRTYLYYVATDDPAINIRRVHNRVALHGHNVPVDRIESRYYKSLDLLMDAVRHSNRAYIFDNSTDSPDPRHTWLAEITDGRTMELKADLIPAWFKRYVLDKIAAG